jgi:alpha-glucosidase
VISCIKPHSQFTAGFGQRVVNRLYRNTHAVLLFLFALIFAAFIQVGTAAAEPVIARSPDGRTELVVSNREMGRAAYTITRDGKPIIAPSQLGFLFTDQPKFDRDIDILNPIVSSADSTWEQPWGERRFVRDNHIQLSVTLRERGSAKRSIQVHFRIFNDGVAFRYHFDASNGWGTLNIADELTEITVAENGKAWWIPGGEWNRYEYLYNSTRISEVAQAHTPITLRLDSGTHIAIHEAALVNYSAMWLRRVSGQQFKAVLSPSGNGPKVVVEAPFSTPWRTIQISPDAAGLANSDMILNLNEPNVLGDVSWVKPSKYIGMWWEMHINKSTWGPGPNHGATTANTRRYIDFAAQNGFRGVLVEGWNPGWEGDWYTGGSPFDFTRAYPDFDIEGLATYAREKGVRIIGHHETAANIANYEAQMEAAFDLYERLGIDSVKTGYVGDFFGVRYKLPDGSIGFTTHDGQRQVRHHLAVVQAAARRHIAINAHEPIKDTGLRRTYPNWISREGARGMEYNAWGTPPNPPEHEPTLAFTRMLAGPMDFTPGIFDLKRVDNGNRVKTTLAKQLALYVVLYSPIQMAADLPENYAANPQAFQFIKDVVTDWHDSRVLNGAVGEYVTVARRDRNSDTWFLGAITDSKPRVLSVRLDFLDPTRRYRAEVYADGRTADWDTNPLALDVKQLPVSASQTLRIRLAPGGGQAIRFVPL